MDPAVLPMAPAGEVCNDGVDNDCDSSTPDIFDADSDGFTCDIDCSDMDPSISPGVSKIRCDGIDNDCDHP